MNLQDPTQLEQFKKKAQGMGYSPEEIDVFLANPEAHNPAKAVSPVGSAGTASQRYATAQEQTQSNRTVENYDRGAISYEDLKKDPLALNIISSRQGFNPPATYNPNEENLRKEYTSRTDTQSYIKINDAYQGIKSSGNDYAGKLTAVYNYIKMNDPNAVREGEIALTQGVKLSPLLQTLWYQANNGVITDEKLKEIKNQAYSLFVTKQGQQRKIADFYKGQAKTYGMNPDAIAGYMGEYTDEAPLVSPEEIAKMAMSKQATDKDIPMYMDPVGSLVKSVGNTVWGFMNTLGAAGQSWWMATTQSALDQESKAYADASSQARQEFWDAQNSGDNLKSDMAKKKLSQIEMQHQKKVYGLSGGLGTEGMAQKAAETLSWRKDLGVEGSFNQGFVSGLSTVANVGMRTLAMEGLAATGATLAGAAFGGAPASFAGVVSEGGIKPFLSQALSLGKQMVIYNSAIYGTGQAIQDAKDGKNATMGFVRGSVSPKVGIIEAVTGDKEVAPYIDSGLMFILPYLGEKFTNKTRNGETLVDNSNLDNAVDQNSRSRLATEAKTKAGEFMLGKKGKGYAETAESAEEFLTLTKGKKYEDLAMEAPKIVKDRGDFISTRISEIDDSLVTNNQSISGRFVKDYLRERIDSSSYSQAVKNSLSAKIETLSETPTVSEINKLRLNVNEAGKIPTGYKSVSDIKSPSQANRISSNQFLGGELRNVLSGIDDSLGRAVHEQHIALWAKGVLDETLRRKKFTGATKTLKIPTGGGKWGAFKAAFNVISQAYSQAPETSTINFIRKNAIITPFTSPSLQIPTVPQSLQVSYAPTPIENIPAFQPPKTTVEPTSTVVARQGTVPKMEMLPKTESTPAIKSELPKTVKGKVVKPETKPQPLARRTEAAKTETKPTSMSNSLKNKGVNTVWHETDPSTAMSLAFGSVDKNGLNVSATPELALGQRGKGAVVEIDTSRLSGMGIKKPGAEFIKSQTGSYPEYRIIGGPSKMTPDVKSITFDGQPKNEFTLNSYGWKKEVLPNGKVKYTNPNFLENYTETSKPAAKPQPLGKSTQTKAEVMDEWKAKISEVESKAAKEDWSSTALLKETKAINNKYSKLHESAK